MIDKNDADQILFVVLGQYNVNYDRQEIGNSVVYTVDRFGARIVYLDGQEFDKSMLKGWHVGWIHPDYDMEKSRKVVVWTLMQGGFFHYLRNSFKNTFNRMISIEGWDKIIADERLRRFKDTPKFNYFRELNKDALQESASYVLAVDPGFYDHMESIND